MKRLPFPLLSVALLAIFAAPLHAASPSSMERLIAAAKKEGTLELLAPSTLGPQGAQALGAAFNRKYALNTKTNYSPSNNMVGDVAKVVTQSAAGATPEWDLMVVTDAHHATLWLRKLHQPFDYGKLGINPRWIQYDNGSVIMANQFVYPAYNKNNLPAKDVPKKWEDLLDPKWKGGKLGMSTTTHHLARLAAGAWGEPKTTEFVKALAKQDLSLGTLGELYTRLQTGEILLAATLTDSYVITAKKAGAPIVHAEGIEPVVSPAYNAGVPKGAAHPNSGALFAIFLTTAEGQKLWEEYGGQSSAFIPGTTANKYAQGKKVLYMTPEQAEMIDRLSTEYGKILGFTK
ncbi:MAG TPA: extracellular solute-binding protein [Candidatus Binatia bacterium]|jgi:iron(III) transport system substrate-binding protein